MNPRYLLAARLREAVQGCSIHSHGPIQAWAAIEEARIEGTVQPEEVAKLAIDACTRRIDELRQIGVEADDPGIRKEELTRSFIERLFYGQT